VHASQLENIGIRTPQQLLDQGATPKGRVGIADRSGISAHLILEWVNHVDLYRIKGVGSEYADLLEASGVDTVVELATRNPAHLYEALVTVNDEKKLVRRLPTAAQVGDWVQQAKGLPRVIQY
jgi:predicted flap endonuclease-1-like 5' DNA nuclease